MQKKKTTKREKIATFLYEIGKFWADAAKLVLGGVIIAGIMDLEIDSTALFVIGGISVIAMMLFGAFLITIYKDRK